MFVSIAVSHVSQRDTGAMLSVWTFSAWTPEVERHNNEQDNSGSNPTTNDASKFSERYLNLRATGFQGGQTVAGALDEA
jgi:hypothetical protein